LKIGVLRKKSGPLRLGKINLNLQAIVPYAKSSQVLLLQCTLLYLFFGHYPFFIIKSIIKKINLKKLIFHEFLGAITHSMDDDG
jgi:hypothetical protein